VCTATLMSDPPCTLGFVDAFHSINSPYDYWLRDNYRKEGGRT